MQQLPERRNLDELVALYRLEPEVRDVYVEGPFDADVIGWFLRRSGTDNVTVYEVDSIQIPMAILDRWGFDSGNRQRVVAAAMYFGEQLEGETPQLSCIIDADADRVSGELADMPYLIHTDYSCLEMYCYNAETAEKFFRIGVGRSPLEAGEMLGIFDGVLQELFAIRCARVCIGSDIPWMSFTRCCRKRGNDIVFDKEQYLFRLLNQIGEPGRTTELAEIANTWKGRFGPDARHQINGHDFCELLSWYLHHFCNVRVPVDEVGRRLLVCTDYDVLRREPLFDSVLRRVQRRTG